MAPLSWLPLHTDQTASASPSTTEASLAQSISNLPFISFSHQLPLLQKRAYLAQFLVDEPIPEELFLDPEIQDTHALVKELQEQFKEVHKAVDQSRKTQRDPRSLKAQLAGLEGEKEQLGGRVDRVKEKTKVSYCG